MGFMLRSSVCELYVSWLIRVLCVSAEQSYVVKVLLEFIVF